jgi:outer membrane protein assembly factor BamB
MADLLRDRIYVGAAGHVAAIDAATGRELWRTKLRGRGFVTTGIVGERVVAATGGHLFSLDPATGSIVWDNELKGLGYGLISFPGGASALEAAVAAAERNQRAAAAT